MSDNVNVAGSVSVGGTGCAPTDIDQTTKQLQLLGACDRGLSYQSCVKQNGIEVATAGAIGAAYVGIGATVQFTSIEFLYLKSSARVRLRFTNPDLSVVVMPDVEGLQLYQFPRSPNAPTVVEVSGVARIDIIAAGRTSA